jgi:hypothetical protein
MDVHDPQVRLVDKGRGLKDGVALLLLQVFFSECVKLVINQRPQARGSRAIAELQVREEIGHVLCVRAGHG